MSHNTTAAAATPGLVPLQFRTDHNALARRQAEEFWATWHATQTDGAARPWCRAVNLHGVTHHRAHADGGRTLKFIAVSEGTKRDQSQIRVDGIDTANLERNGVFLWGHDYQTPPIGRIVKVEKEDHLHLGRVLAIEVERLRTIDGTDHIEFANMILNMYERGDMHAVSFGWVPLEVEPLLDDEGEFRGFDFVRSDGLETSAVTVPADPDAGLQDDIQTMIQRGVIPRKYIDKFVVTAGLRRAAYILREVPLVDATAPPAAEVGTNTSGVEASTANDDAAVALAATPDDASRPMPKPGASEDHDEFISRCMGDLKGEFPDHDQRLAVCETQWQDRAGAGTGAEIAAALPRDDDAMGEARAAFEEAVGLLDTLREEGGEDADDEAYDQRVAARREHLLTLPLSEKLQRGLLARAAYGDEPPEDVLRWNPQLSRAWDVERENFPPASPFHALAARYLDCEIKEIREDGVFIRSNRMGAWLEALDQTLQAQGWEILDTKNVRSNGTELPLGTETIKLNSTRTGTYLVDGTRFMMLEEKSRRVVFRVQPDYFGLDVWGYAATPQGGAALAQLLERTAEVAAGMKLLKGEAFSISGAFLERAAVGWDDLFLVPENETALRWAVGKLNEKGMEAPARGVLLMGPPGTGKTLAGRVMMRTAPDTTFIWVSSRDFYHMGAVGGVIQAFEMARELAPSILFIEDIDNWMDERFHDLLKTELDGLDQARGLITVMTSNDPQRLPPALIDRPGRFHEVLQIDLPDTTNRDRMLQRWIPAATEHGRGAAVDATAGYSGAYVRELAEFANALAEEHALTADEGLRAALLKLEKQRALIKEVQRVTYAPRREIAEVVAERAGQPLDLRESISDANAAVIARDAALIERFMEREREASIACFDALIARDPMALARAMVDLPDEDRVARVAKLRAVIRDAVQLINGAEVREGKVLSRANATDLDRIIELAHAIKARALTEAPGEESAADDDHEADAERAALTALTRSVEERTSKLTRREDADDLYGAIFRRTKQLERSASKSAPDGTRA